MKNVININERGTLTLPKEMRTRLGIKGEGQIIAEETAEGIVLKAGVAFPIEMYTDERIAEFQRNNEDALKKFSFKK
ncbi:MAG: AbrB/MazE/SpoVT family DNA-binding domain-containing protein [bacterium]|nr:AbrB/MazE/SpoVT family DNA-binding domain-containing protein [bacterium]